MWLLNNRNLFLTDREAGTSEIKVPADSMSDSDSILIYKWSPQSVSSRGEETRTLLVPVKRALIPPRKDSNVT